MPSCQVLLRKPKSARIDAMDKTVKIRAYSDDPKNDASRGNLTEDQNNSLELTKKNTQLEEEKNKSLEHIKTIEQLRESLRREQARTADSVKTAAGPDANALAVKDAQLEEEKSRSLENLRTIVQLRESLKLEQAKSAEMAKKMVELDAKVKALAVLEENQFAKKNAQLEEEKRKSLEHIQTIEQLRESLKQEQAKTADMVKMTAELEARTKELAELEAKVKDLNGLLSKISSVAAMGKLVSDS